MPPEDSTTRIALFPLPNVVHFPGTELRLHIFEPRYRQLVTDLLDLEPEERRIGMVLTRPANEPGEEPEVFPGGTAGLLTEVESLPDGRSNIVLLGDFRFRIQREIGGNTYRQALVSPVGEPWLDERNPSVSALRRELVELVESLSEEVGDRFPVDPEQLADLAGLGRPSDPRPFERLVNNIAADLDLPALRKLTLLNEALPERAVHLTRILRGRKDALDLLRPFRHLDGSPASN